MDSQLRVPYYHNTLTHQNEFIKPAEFIPTADQMEEWGWFMRGQMGVVPQENKLNTPAARMLGEVHIEMGNPIHQQSQKKAEAPDDARCNWKMFEDSEGHKYWQNMSTEESLWEAQFLGRFPLHKREV